MQEPLLETVRISPQTWEALGGPAVVEAAVQAGCQGVLLQLREGLAYGPYAQAIDLWAVLRSCSNSASGLTADELSAVADMVRCPRAFG